MGGVHGRRIDRCGRVRGAHVRLAHVGRAVLPRLRHDQRVRRDQHRRVHCDLPLQSDLAQLSGV